MTNDMEDHPRAGGEVSGAGWTEGPWSYRSQPHDDWGVVRAGRFWICQAKDPNVYTDDQLAAHRAAGTDPWEANARLITAAPDLYAAVAAAEEYFAGLPEDDVVVNPLYLQMNAALARARGDL